MNTATDQTILEWGSSGLEPSESAAVPHELNFFKDAEYKVTSIAFGEEHGCAVASRRSEEGILLTWGSNSHGQLGHSKPARQPSRVDALDLYSIKSVACGKLFTMALTSCGKVLSFGSNDRRELGHTFDKKIGKPKLVKFIPVPRILPHGAPKIVSIASGSRHSLLLAEDGTVWGCGDNSDGQLAQSALNCPDGATLVKELYGIPIKKVACGGMYSMALTTSGNVYSWGSNIYGQLGHGSKINSHVPRRIQKLTGIVDISAGTNHCAAVTSEGKCFVWGSGSHGQIASSAPCLTTPVVLTGMDGCEFGQVTKVLCGRAHTVLVAERYLSEDPEKRCYKLFSFGCNEMGQLGNGNVLNRNSIGYIPLSAPLSIDLSHALYTGPGDQMLLLSSNEIKSVTSSYGLTLSEIQGLVSAVESNDSSSSGSLLVSQLQLNLYSLSRLNSSFLSDNHLNLDGRLDPTVSLKDAKEAFELLASMKNKKWAPQIHKLLHEASVTSQSHVTSFSSSHLSPESLRGFLILFENPLLVANKENLESVRRLANVINELSDGQKKVFENWWIQNPYLLSNFKTAVLAFNKALSYFTLKRLEAPAIATLQVLKWLWTINNLPFADDDPLEFKHLETTYKRLEPVSETATTEETMAPSPLNPTEPFPVPTNAHMASMFAAMGTLGATPTIEVQLDPENLPEGRMPTPQEFATMAARAFTQQMESLFKNVSDISLGDRPSPRTLIPHSDFINDTLSKRIDFKSDFMMLYASSRPGVFGPNRDQGGLSNVFSFCKYPFCFTLAARMMLLGIDAQRQMIESQSMSLMRHLHSANRSPGSDAAGAGSAAGPPEPETVNLLIQVRRRNLLHDAFKAVGKFSVENLKKPLKVQFLNEMGLDGGGVSREFMDLFFRRLLKQSDMFVDVDVAGSVPASAAAAATRARSGFVWFNHLSERPLAAYKTVGRILGLALFNKCLAAAAFPPVLFKRLLGWPATMSDLEDLQPSTARWLKQMLAHDDPTTFDESYYGLEFAVTVQMRKHEDKSVLVEPYKNVELPGVNAGKPVTYENRSDYVKSMIHWHTGGSVESMLKEFRRGFLEACGGPVLDQLLPSDLEALLRGKDTDNANFNDLETVAKYKEPYHKDHAVIKRFWSVFHALPVDFKYKFLKFMTGTDTIPPIRGLKEIQIVIQPSGAGATSQTQEPPSNTPSTPTRSTEPRSRDATSSSSTQTPPRNNIQTPIRQPQQHHQPQQQQPGERLEMPELETIFSGPGMPPLPPPGSAQRQALEHLRSLFGPRPGLQTPAQAAETERLLQLEEDESDFDSDEGGSEMGDFAVTDDDFVDDNSNDEDEGIEDYEGGGSHHHFGTTHVLGSVLLDLGQLSSSSSSSSSSRASQSLSEGHEDAAAMAVESSTGPVSSMVEGGSSLLNDDNAGGGGSSSSNTRGKKRTRDEEDEDELDEWENEGNVSENEYVHDDNNDLMMTVGVDLTDEKGKGRAMKKIKTSGTPIKKKSTTVYTTTTEDWTKSVILDTGLNEKVLLDNVDEQRLPVAHTCAFVLDLPAYQTVEKLMERLVYAVENSGEFHLV